MLALLLLLSVLGAALSSSGIGWDAKSFTVDGERTLLIGGSFHYPRAAPSEWPSIMSSMRANNLNLLQTYVFWDLHEPTEGDFFFPDDPADERNLVLFLRTAQAAGLHVHLRIGPYSCAEWSNGGLPSWLLGDESVWRTDDSLWLDRVTKFTDATLDLVKRHGLLHSQGGPVILAQIENEYGNVQADYGDAGAAYVSKLAGYVLAKDDLGDIPWVMCQQGEGTGTSPPEDLINACNGYYCDNWIEKHAEAFPNQPHMFTENWPGWYQKWGEAAPHRPATDVAFSVARWFAKGGSFHNYYMAFGGTSFGRHVGGPNIVTSYDYDVAVNEYGFEAEPKFSLTAALHKALFEVQDLMFAHPDALPGAGSFNGTSSCETHTYSSSSGCVSFLSNINTDSSATCHFSPSVSIPAWSVTIVTSASNDCSASSADLAVVHGTKDLSALPPANSLLASPADGFEIKSVELTFVEPVPTLATSAADSSPAPIEQLSLTADSTDYLWYSFAATPASSTATVSFPSHVNTGVCYYLYASGRRVADECGGAILDDFATKTVTFKDVPVSAGAPNDFALLAVAMGIRNYGVHLETNVAGLAGAVTVDGGEVAEFKHDVGMSGERGEKLPLNPFGGVDGDLSWYSLKFDAPAALPSALALDLSSMGKGAAYINGNMLGRFWDKAAPADGCDVCDELAYSKSYAAEDCRTGCGEMSQRYYKVPTEWLVKGENEVVLFQERPGDGEGAKGVEFVAMEMV
ncbi:hypothetical protein TeGR_g2538 [Tetraparma gracilis]|uniref:Beta-galactosidase n=1 Tax=Tetraparma gracilis TaxID=2962635 RepID=A0ABQ6N4Q1_9STRA|nr:hypothetical protein TeGR_g2538 [Tetraparma gracilis]